MSDISSTTPLPLYRRFKRWQIILFIVILAAGLRLWASWQLPVDADEPVYLRAGQSYAAFLKSGNLSGVLQYDFNIEHPPLVKLMYSLPYLVVQPQYGVALELHINRLISVVWGVLAVFVLALIDPLAGFLLAVDSMVIKYTSQVYLEGFPLFAGLLAVYAILKWRKVERPAWLWVSAAAVGAAVAGKYLYGLMGLPVLLILIQKKPGRWKNIGAVFFFAGLTFLLLDPAIWLNPIARLIDSLTYHWRYSQSSLDVIRANYPWFQPLVWVTAMVPWHPQVFFFPAPDALIFAFALAGSYLEWKTRRWLVIWAVFTLIILLIWPTHWPQYTLVLIPALCLLAATAIRWLVRWFLEFNASWHISETIMPQPGKIFWVALVLFLVVVTVGKVGYEINLAMARSGWNQFEENISPLPSDRVNDILIARDGRVVIATDNGIVFWQPTQQSPWGDDPQVIRQQNSGLVNDQVLTVLESSDGGWWFGTVAGLSRVNADGQWQSYRSNEIGLADERIQCLIEDSSGLVWVGTKSGAAFFDGNKWQQVTSSNSGLASDAVFSIVEQVLPQGKYLWFGTLHGTSRMDTSSGEWLNTRMGEYGIGWAGVVDLLVDHQGRVFAATMGDGLAVWDGSQWKNLKTSNSPIPLNSVTKIIESSPGIFWLSLSYSSEPGGMLARLEGDHWQSFTPANSGFNGGEVKALAQDRSGRLWIGTVVNGLQSYLGSLLKSGN